ncbi:MAG: metallophosphoesterase [Eubacteriales bacterium]
MYSKTALKTLPFLGKCLIFIVLCWNFISFFPVVPRGFTPIEFGLLAALLLAFLPFRVTSFAFLAVAELSFFYLVYDLLYALVGLVHARELFLKITLDGGLVPILCVLHLAYGVILAKRIITTFYSVPTKHALPGGKLRILQLSDMHPGRFQTRRTIRRIYSIAEETKPDMVVLTGDIFDEFTQPSKFRGYCELFSSLRPKYGVWYVYGNHDTDWHWRRPDHTREDIERCFAEAGVRILEDECAVTGDGKIRVAGRRDLSASEERQTPEELLAAPFDGLTILLCHEPVELKACAEAGADVIFAGHTHGGQIFPVGFLMKRMIRNHEMNDGIGEVLPGRYAVVSRGVGTWGYPVRTEGKSEAVVVDIEEIQ